jgi:hypothetical protein
VTRPGTCPVCPDPTCPVRDGTFAMAYHWLEMLHEAYDVNGTPRSDAVLMGVASLQELVDLHGVIIGEAIQRVGTDCRTDEERANDILRARTW